MKTKPNYIILSALSFSFFIASPVKAEPFTMAAVGAFLLPILKPIAEGVIKDTAGAIVSAVQKLSQKSARCNRCNKLPLCKVSTTFSICKNDCQALVTMGGFELRLRFVPGDWNLTDCVKKGVVAQLQTASGKGNARSIAIYSQEDLDFLKEILAYKVAAEKVVRTAGADALDEIKKENPGAPKEQIQALTQRAVNESKVLVQKIDEGIREEVSKGRFGYQ